MRGFAWAFGQSVGGLLVQLITLVVLSRLLTPSEFGIVAIVVSLLGGLTLVVELGVGPALIQRPSITSRHIGSAIWLSMSLAIALVVALQLFAHPLAVLLGIGAQVTALRVLTATGHDHVGPHATRPPDAGGGHRGPDRNGAGL